MKLRFIFFGKKNSSMYDYEISKYLKRLNYYMSSECVFYDDTNIVKLNQKMEKKIKTSDFLIALDEQGKQLSTTKYSNFLSKLASDYNTINIVVGSAYGINDLIINKANYLLSLSNMTFPHLLARLVVVEQTYRALTILNNHPYHHE